MVDVSSQSNKVNITVSSSGVSSNVNASGDTSHYYSEKAREWAISNRIVDGVDYSSKYYAGRANQSALNAQSFAQSAQDSYNNFQQSVDGALSTVNDTVQDAITTIDTQSGEAIETINDTVDGAIEDIEAEANEQIGNIERTGFYMRDDKLYFINSNGEEEEFKTNDNELNNPFSLLDYKYSEYELNNLSWLRSNGQYNSKAIYPAVYDLLLKIYNGTETKAGVSVKLATETFTDYDFVLNTAEETFRLPIKVKLASGKAVVGNGMTLGLTNGTDNYGLANHTGGEVTRLQAYKSSYGSNVGVTNSGSVYNGELTFGVTTDPTKSGIETSDSGLYLYFYVGETVQNANLINAGRIEEKITEALAKPHIIETYINGYSWYRIYSDGWCEQGGMIRGMANGAFYTINLIKSYINNNYSILANGFGANSTAFLGINTDIQFVSKATTGFKVAVSTRVANDTEDGVFWQTCGYIV